ncbi:MAG: 30S ribosomal protein S16 [Bacilli bacterium]
MLKIRLTRIGRHEKAIYRIVVADERKARDGRFIEQIGQYDASKGLDGVVIDEAKAIEWLAKGAKPSDTLKAVLTKKGILAKLNDAKLAEVKGK